MINKSFIIRQNKTKQNNGRQTSSEMEVALQKEKKKKISKVMNLFWVPTHIKLLDPIQQLLPLIDLI